MLHEIIGFPRRRAAWAAPGPIWAIAALPLVFLVWLGMRGWLRVRPGKRAEALAWG